MKLKRQLELLLIALCIIKIMKLKKKKTVKCLVEMLQLIRTIYCRTARFIELLVTKTVYSTYYLYIFMCVRVSRLMTFIQIWSLGVSWW